ncbi:hypothetical protein B0H15DRAFT_899587, partial [Mycena belliarum]
MPSPPPPGRNKKVSRACNTCRLKRKKCDGLEPCIFCTDTKVECSYSREPRRRGPPSGYLRYMEMRVTILETLLGRFIQTSGPQSALHLYNAACTLSSESKSRTQDVWDAYKQVWSACDAARPVHELVITFAPFSPADNHTPAVKALLPVAGKQSAPPSPAQAPPPSPPDTGFSCTNESFERTHSNEPPAAHFTERTHTTNVASITDLDPMPMFLPSPPADSVIPSTYPGAYWRPADLASSSSPAPLSPTLAAFSSGARPPSPVDLPPPHVRAALLATYHAAVHPSLPVLSHAQAAAFSVASPPDAPMLLLALFAYTARLAPAPTRVAADLWYESALTLLTAALRRAELSTDVVQTLLLLALRDHGRGCDAQAWRGAGAAVRVAQELGLDSDANQAGHAHMLWGVVTMVDLFLSIQLGRAPAVADALRPLISPAALANGDTNRHASLPSPASTSTPAPAPALPYTSAPPAPDYAGAATSTAAYEDEDDAALFTHTCALVRIIARVHFLLGLRYSAVPGAGESESASTDGLALELAAWHRSLPARFHVALGGERVPRAVLEVHMLYHVGVGMLGCTRSSDSAASTSGGSGFGSGGGSGLDLGAGVDVDVGTYAADEAASAFNVLLDRYRPSLALAGPHVVWLVFAAARACLAAGSKRDVGRGTARALQTQLHLLNCREALAGMGATWELARRCARALERLMCADADALGPGKRNRGDGDGPAEGAGARKRR